MHVHVKHKFHLFIFIIVNYIEYNRKCIHALDSTIKIWTTQDKF